MSVFNLDQKKIGIKWWEWVLLWFKKPIYGYDWGSEDKSVVAVAKKLNGKLYIVDEFEVEDLKNGVSKG